MPFRWRRGENLYADNHFSRLGAGPTIERAQVNQLAKDKARGLSGEDSGIQQAGIADAQTALTSAAGFAEELLISHSPLQRENNLGEVADRLRAGASLPDCEGPLALCHPAALFWFIPPPGPEILPTLTWEELGLPMPGSPEDLALDIVFDF